jgi:hypothetical protein
LHDLGFLNKRQRFYDPVNIKGFLGEKIEINGLAMAETQGKRRLSVKNKAKVLHGPQTGPNFFLCPGENFEKMVE